MNTALLFIACAAGVFFSLVAQDFIPPLTLFGGARVLLVPVFFCLGGLSLPFLLMVALAVWTGLLCDMAYLQVVQGKIEIAIGWSIFYYVVVGAILQGLRPLFLRGHWELHAFASGLCVCAYLLAQFVMISFRRFEDGFFLNQLVFWRILVPGSIAFLISPAVYFSLRPLMDRPVHRRNTTAYEI